MILEIAASLKEILERGKDYPWPKPSRCPRCGRTRLWGHGFVGAYLDGCKDGILLRRYRCPECGCVIRLKPKGYFKRFQAAMETIRAGIRHRLETNKWPPAISRGRWNHWFKALGRQAKAHLGHACCDLLQAFDRLCELGRIPVSRSI